ncbi:FUSC family protein [Neiella marina]|uniref:FUSC family protein n=1 Tax=Neiella holothuriorum TaxID=2870530 RepID=A0ABS7EB94_9GAMM|nr:FUSC family membrane protein [Neiella holothuriorum]MBW8189603.1 FUSC family protein [Neiella holothuriorum]
MAYFSPPSTRSPWFITAVKASFLTAVFLMLGWLQENLVMMSAMSMGVSAAALSDHPSQYAKRATALFAMLICFGSASFSVVLLFQLPWLFAIALAISTYLLLMAAAFGTRLGRICFGALNTAVFTMLSYNHHAEPLWLPLMLVGGSVCYFILSSLVHWFIPNFNLEHDSRQLFSTLAKYQLLKARFFDDGTDPAELRLRLAKLGAQASAALANVRQQLIVRQQQDATANRQSGYLEQFFKAQLLLERLSSSHLLYQELRVELADTSLPARIQRVMVGLSKRMLRQPRYRQQLSYSMNDAVENELTALSDSIERLAARQVFSQQCASQLNYLLTNLRKVCELTERQTPFPNPDFLFSEQHKLNWKDYGRLCLSRKTPLFRHATRVSLCMLVGYGIVQLLPADSQNYWLLLTVLFITKPTFSETKQRLWQRIVGTVAGIALATALYWLALPDVSLIVIAVLAKFVFFWYLQQRYSIAVGCVSVYVAILLQFYGLDAEALFAKRILITVGAAGLVFLALRYLWPDWLQQRSRAVIAASLHAIKDYQSAIFSQYLSQQHHEDETYRLARFHAHVTEASLVEHWQALLAEPRSKQSEASTLYLLTGRLHAYLSYLSALASHRGTITSATALPLVERIGERLSEQLNQLEAALANQPLLGEHGEHQELSSYLSKLTPNLQGQDLMVTFQLLRLNENIQQIRQLLLAQTDWQLASPIDKPD